jgi:SWI/SNF-related matrix-associated actin-dependent regulator of chromatin subfamily D
MDPIVLHYTIDPTQPPPEKPVAYDVEIRVEDTSLKSRMSHVVMNMAPESAKELSKLDDEVRSPFIPRTNHAPST